jgi:hypothetical protein
LNYLYNRVFLFWNIGKSVYEKENSYFNVIEKYSNYCSYYFGNSIQFTRENIHLMKRFYMNFPIYHSKLNEFSWEQYQLLLSIQDKKERAFYYSLLILFQSNYQELVELLENHYYERI